MFISETKKLLICLLVIVTAVLFLPKDSTAQDASSTNFTVEDPVISSGFLSSSSTSFGLGQSLAQLAIGKSTSASFQLWSGFQYFYNVDANVLTATAGDAEVDLSWTVPDTSGGVNVGGYEVGTGTVSGSYTFESVGNVVSYTKTGLTNGTEYFFIVKALTAAGTFLVYSNEDSATPNGATPPPPPPPSSGGGGTTYGNIVINGAAYPNAAITLLRDSLMISSAIADTTGNFSFSLTNQPSGTYSFGVYAIDVDGLKSPTLGFLGTVSSSVTTTISDLIIAPTIRQSHTVVQPGQAVTISGYSQPAAVVTLSLSGTQNSTQTTSGGANGYYAFALNTSSLPKGVYQVSTSGKSAGSAASPSSAILQLEVGDRTEIPPPTGQCGRSDFNCDGKVELIDFSILLYYWDVSDFSSNPKVDIDKSGAVGLRDLSIMLYDWTG